MALTACTRLRSRGDKKPLSLYSTWQMWILVTPRKSAIRIFQIYLSILSFYSAAQIFLELLDEYKVHLRLKP